MGTRAVALVSLLLAGGCDVVVGIKPVAQPMTDAAPQFDGMPDAAPPPPCGLMSMLADDFNDNDLFELWPGNSQATENNGVVTFDAAATTYAQLSASRFFDFRNGSVSAKFDSPSTFDASSELNMILDSRKRNFGLRIRRGLSGFTFYRKENGQESVIATKPFSTNDKYWKIANNGGVAEFSFSPDGVSYTNAATYPGLTYIDFMSPTFTAYRSATPLIATLDDVNGGTPAGSACPVHTLKDDFEGTTLDEQWVRSHTNNTGTITVSNGYADLAFPTSTSDAILQGPTFFDLRDDQFVIEVPQNVATTTTNTFSIEVHNVAGDRIEFFISGTEIRAWQYTNGQILHGSGTFVPGTHVWFRFRSSGNFVYWETSADGTNWGSPFGSTNDFPGLDRVELLVAVAANNGTAGAVHLDHWNIPPP